MGVRVITASSMYRNQSVDRLSFRSLFSNITNINPALYPFGGGYSVLGNSSEMVKMNRNHTKTERSADFFCVLSLFFALCGYGVCGKSVDRNCSRRANWNCSRSADWISRRIADWDCSRPDRRCPA